MLPGERGWAEERVDQGEGREAGLGGPQVLPRGVLGEDLGGPLVLPRGKRVCRGEGGPGGRQE